MKIQRAAAFLTVNLVKISNKPQKIDKATSRRITERTKVGFQLSTRMNRKTARKIQIIEPRRKIRRQEWKRRLTLEQWKMAR